MLVVARAPAFALSPSTATLRPRRAACGAAAQLRAQRPKSGVVLAASRRTVCAAGPPLDLTEENVEQVLLDARSELGQMFDEQMGMTGARRRAGRQLTGRLIARSAQARARWLTWTARSSRCV
jgi:hypothetical protein